MASVARFGDRGRVGVEYILALPGTVGPDFVAALSRFGEVKAAYQPEDIKEILDEFGPPKHIVVSGTQSSLVPLLQKFRERLPEAYLSVAGRLTPAQLRDIEADTVVGYPFPEDFVPGGLSDAVLSAARSAFRDVSGLVASSPGVERPTLGKETVVFVTSGKGGDGKTTLTMQLAILAKRRGIPCVVVDGDYSGNAHAWLGVEHVMHTVADFASVKEDMNRATLDGLLLEVRGLRVLPRAPVGSPAALANAVRACKAFYPLVIVDMPHGITPLLEVARDFATHVVLVTLPSERRIAHYVETVTWFVKMGVRKKNLRLVVNKLHGTPGESMVRSAVGAAVGDYEIPVFALPWNDGLDRDDDPDFVPVAASMRNRRDPYTAAFVKLANSILGAPPKSAKSEGDPSSAKSKNQSAKAKKRSSSGWLLRLFGGRRKKKGAKQR